MDKIKLAIRQARAAKVAEYAFQQRLDKIQWEEETLNPYLEELRQQITLTGAVPVLELEANEGQDDHNPT